MITNIEATYAIQSDLHFKLGWLMYKLVSS